MTFSVPPWNWYRQPSVRRTSTRPVATTLTPASLLGLMLLVVLGAVVGSVGWVARDWAARQMAIAAEVNLALNDAQRLRAEGNYREGLSAAKRAVELSVNNSANQDLQDRVRDARKDLEMVVRLEGMLFDLTSVKKDPLRFDFVKVDSEYAKAFREYGIDAEALEPATAGELIRRRPIKLELALALDGWAEARRYALSAPVPAPHQSKCWQQLLAAASAADPDP